MLTRTPMLRTTATAARTLARAKSTTAAGSSASSSASSADQSSSSSPSPQDQPVHSHQPSKTSTSRPLLKTSPTDPNEYKRLLEERFGGAEAAALGQLVDGQPEGMAANVKRNMFRLI
ncbi:hypothetical protein JCM8097_009021 [Rhodosporidiobolus ruineniae]